MPFIPSAATILAGQSLSDECDIGSNQPYMLITPPEWTPATVTFEISVSTSPFYKLYYQGRLWQMDIQPNVAIMLQAVPYWPRGLKVKIRSGTPTNPIKQTANRVFGLLTG